MAKINSSDLKGVQSDLTLKPFVGNCFTGIGRGVGWDNVWGSHANYFVFFCNFRVTWGHSTKQDIY